MKPSSSSSDGPRVNQEISKDPIRLIDNKGKMLGVVKLLEALTLARNNGLDLVEVSPNATPPVCKILDHGKLKFINQKKAAEARKKQKTIDVKEVKLRPNIDVHDYEIKMKSVEKFLSSGDKVKVTMRFRGREMAHQNLGVKVLEKVKLAVEGKARIEQMPKIEGKQMVMVLAPGEVSIKK